MNRKILIGLLVVSSLYLSFAGEAEARRRRGFGGGGAVAAILGAGLLSNAFNNNCASYGGYGYDGGYGGYGYAPATFGGYGYGGSYGYDPYYAAPAYGYAPAYGGYGYNPYYRPSRRRSNIIPALIGAGILYSVLRNR